jgi:hypothetical protein
MFDLIMPATLMLGAFLAMWFVRHPIAVVLLPAFGWR